MFLEQLEEQTQEVRRSREVSGQVLERKVDT
jgi:hypothetical protein